MVFAPEGLIAALDLVKSVHCFGKDYLVSLAPTSSATPTPAATPTPSPTPMYCGDHDSHIAGITAAQRIKFGFTGTAPDAALGANRVFGCKGQISDVLIATYKAYQDGTQIITAFTTGPSSWSEGRWLLPCGVSSKMGIPCTVSAGNEGARGIFSG
ncbi:Uncharacterized protein TCAP_06372 [Tolypocladium capitatum]|uniref:Peptidase S8/S53 domain-containing protein n=1 Tax=Tolypocladium capitatum TaxID=45235 RepID=A0A2K3Q7Z4_9HYPO|nr:Uncharacterized protein TCAP_06372 [Tolypocladium capitatum]